MKYKIGDKVKINSLDWYDKNKNFDGIIYLNNFGIPFIKEMSAFCGKKAIIEFIYRGEYKIDIDGKKWSWEDWMFEDETSISDQIKEMRFHAACCAMQGAVTGIINISNDSCIWDHESVVKQSYIIADELLKQGGFTE